MTTQITDKQLDPKIYEYIVFQYNSDKDIMLAALNIVRDYIIANNLVITGGMAVDFALKLKGDKLYDDATLPDYDFFSPENHIHAYELGQILCKTLKYANGDSPKIDVIDAIHITTMKVRVNYVPVADITYLPPEVFEKLPKLTYNIPTENGQKAILFRHPHMQMVDQHRALSLPYEGAPREVILHRWRKDMKRFDLLYNHYPIEGKALDISKFTRVGIDPTVLANNAVGGFAALYLLKNSSASSTSTSNSNSDTPDIRLPTGEPLVIWSDKPEDTAGQIMEIYREHVIKYFNPYLDLLPSSIHVIIERPQFVETAKPIVAQKKPELLQSELAGGGNAGGDASADGDLIEDNSANQTENKKIITGVNEKKFHDPLTIVIYDSTFKLITAEKNKFHHITDAQSCLMYFLLNACLTPEKSIYRDAYVTIAELVENKVKKPTWEVYGSSNVGTEHVLQRTQTLAFNKEIPRIKIMLKPGRFNPSETCEIPPMLGNFSFEESPLFQIDGEEVLSRAKKLVDFLNPLLYDSSSGSDDEN